MGLGSGGGECPSQGLWDEMKLLARAPRARGAEGANAGAWDALDAATRGGAQVVGLGGDIGTLEIGKWADLCCADLSGVATFPTGNPVTQWVFGGGRDTVSDVWVAGRQLLADGELTRLDWPGVAARAGVWTQRFEAGGA